MYAPVSFARAGIASSEMRRQLAVRAASPPVGRYAPNGKGHSLKVLAQPKDVKLLLGGVPVRTDTLKDAGAVLERVGRDGDLRVAERRELSIEVGDAGLDD